MTWNRRTFLTAALGSAAVHAAARAQAPQLPISPNPTPREWSRPEPIAYPDPDIVALDPRFRQYIIFNTSIRRLHIGTQWAEGPAWNGVGRYLVWSDIPNNVQLRWIEDDARVTTFRSPSGYSNGNTFDYQGRQLSCEHGGRRVVRCSRMDCASRPTTGVSMWPTPARLVRSRCGTWTVGNCATAGASPS